MAETWRHLDTGANDPAWNMAFDEALLDASNQAGGPILRFYAWAKASATFGYFQRIADVEAMTPLRPLIRRTTGGGLVPHAADWTYSLAFPAQHRWYAWRATESYREVHEWVRRAFLECGLETVLAPCGIPAAPGQCFAGAEAFDVLWQGRKIAGAAQRRRKNGLLIQGSVQPPPGADRAMWQAAMLRVVSPSREVRWLPWKPSGEYLAAVAKLARDKFAADVFNRRR